MTHVFHLSIANSQFPSQWKVAKIITFFRKDDPLNQKKYRQVAILPVLSRVLEKSIIIQISQYMETHGLLHPNQNGFREAHSTTTCIIQMYDRWVEALEDKKYTGVCFLNLSTAFDTVNHELFLENFKLYGFNQNALLWIASYLEGSILGPLF